MEHQHGDAVGTNAQKRRMSKTDHAAKTQNQVKAGGGQRKNQNTCGHTDVELLARSLRHKRQRSQCDQQHQGAPHMQRVVQQAVLRCSGLGR